MKLKPVGRVPVEAIADGKQFWVLVDRQIIARNGVTDPTRGNLLYLLRYSDAERLDSGLFMMDNESYRQLGPMVPPEVIDQEEQPRI